MTGTCARNYFRCGATLLPWLLTGCTRAPTFDIVGSLFPAWLVCFIFGIFLTVITRFVFIRLQVAIVFEILVYPCLTAVFTFLIWLVFFS